MMMNSQLPLGQKKSWTQEDHPLDIGRVCDGGEWLRRHHEEVLEAQIGADVNELLERRVKMVEQEALDRVLRAWDMIQDARFNLAQGLRYIAPKTPAEREALQGFMSMEDQIAMMLRQHETCKAQLERRAA